jgi:hypothetical protein
MPGSIAILNAILFALLIARIIATTLGMVSRFLLID